MNGRKRNGTEMKRRSILAASLLCSVMLCAQTKETAVLFSGMEFDESFLLTEYISVALDGCNALVVVDGVDETGFVLDDKFPVTAEFKDAFKLKANQDPDNPENYYTTFYTSGGAYKVPEDAKAFVGEMGTVGDFDVLKLTNVGSIIHQSEAVILKAGMSDITLLPSCCQDTASTGNILEGTDTATTLRANQYALSLGKNGVGFYLWNNRPIGANKAYLDFGSVDCVPNFSFGLKFDDGTTTGIPAIITAQPDDDIIYNMQGQRVDGSYDGLVIKNGQRIYNH